MNITKTTSNNKKYHNILIMGKSKSGKTTLTDTIDGKILFINTDGNTEVISKGKDVLDLHAITDDTKKYEVLMSAVKELKAQASQGNLEYEHIVLDNLGDTGNILKTKVALNENQEIAEDAGFGRGTTGVNGRMMPLIDSLTQLPCNLWALAHTTESKSFTSDEVVKKAYGIHKDIYQWAIGRFDMVAELNISSQGNRYLKVKDAKPNSDIDTRIKLDESKLTNINGEGLILVGPTWEKLKGVFK